MSRKFYQHTFLFFKLHETCNLILCIIKTCLRLFSWIQYTWAQTLDVWSNVSIKTSIVSNVRLELCSKTINSKYTVFRMFLKRAVICYMSYSDILNYICHIAVASRPIKQLGACLYNLTASWPDVFRQTQCFTSETFTLNNVVIVYTAATAT